ncbi:hypothetical protein TYRP_015446 [Tyrophagus putrescentiae]|nr:hypothetical protein TYRP_015446 [Tyrophagus putrescentiae]
MKNLLKLLTAPASSLRHLAAGHLHFLKQSLNPIFEVSEEESSETLGKRSKRLSSSTLRLYSSVRLHAGFATFFQLYTTLYGIFGFIPLQSITGVKSVLESDRLYTHQMLPRVAWPQIDAGLAMDIVVSLIIFSILGFRREVTFKNKIFYCIISSQKKEIILINEKKLTAAESKSILKAYWVIKYLLTPGMLATSTFGNVGCAGNAYHQRGKHAFFRPLTLLFWTVAFPAQDYYIAYTLLGPVFYVYLVSAVIQAQQKTLISRLATLNEQVLNQQQNKKQQNISMSFEFTRLNRKYLQLCTFIAEYSHHCKPLLSTTIPYLICVQCYMLYMVLFQSGSLSPTLTLLFLIVTLELELFLLVLVKQCARVSKLNSSFEQLNKRFYLMVIFSGGENKSEKTAQEKKGLFLMKAQSMQLNKRLRVFAFQMVGDYVITQKTFPTVLAYVVTAFLFVIKSNKNSSYARLHAGFAILLQLYTCKNVLESDRLYTHQILPRVAWPQLDAGLGMDIVVSLIIFTILSFKRENALKNTVFYPTASLQKEILINRRSKLTAIESKSILKVYFVIKYLLLPAMVAFWALCSIGFVSHAYYLGVTPFYRPLTLLFWTVAFPWQIYYILYTSFGPVAYVFLVSAVIQAQQRTLITRLATLNEQVLNHQQNRKQQNISMLDFTRLNRKYLQLCTFIAEYSRHCKPYLSTTLPYLICVQCYMLYIVLFQAGSLSATLTLLFLLTTLELELFLLVLVEQCARVSKFNSFFEKMNKKFYLMVIFGGGGGGWLRSSSDELRGVFLLKIESMQLYKRLRVFAFQLVGDYVITKKTFPTVLMYIVTAFLFVVKSNNSH